LGFCPNLEHGTTFETGFQGSKSSWKTAPQAGSDPTAGQVEPAAGNEGYHPIYLLKKEVRTP